MLHPYDPWAYSCSERKSEKHCTGAELDSVTCVLLNKSIYRHSSFIQHKFSHK